MQRVEGLVLVGSGSSVLEELEELKEPVKVGEVALFRNFARGAQT
jgi:hypothetical protein